MSFRHLGTRRSPSTSGSNSSSTDKDAMVIFDLDTGRRAEPLEAAQLAGAVERQQQVSRAVLAQQIDSSSRRHACFRAIGYFASAAIARRHSANGAVGYQPIIQTLPEGTRWA